MRGQHTPSKLPFRPKANGKPAIQPSHYRLCKDFVNPVQRFELPNDFGVEIGGNPSFGSLPHTVSDAASYASAMSRLEVHQNG